MTDRIEIDEKYIIDCLSNYESLLKELRDRVQQLYTNVATTGDVLETLQTKAQQPRPKDRDLEDVLEQYVENEIAYSKYLTEYIKKIMVQEASLKRVWICYQALPYIQRKILTDLYVNKKAWKVVRSEQGMSITTVSNTRAAGLRNIKQMYDSDFSDMQLMTMQTEAASRKRNKKEGDQITIWSLLDSGNTKTGQ